jgi:DNA-binding transcriptional LysR family regulator
LSEDTLPENGRNMDRFDAMSVLLAAVDTGSLSAAGRRLGVPLTTVSRKISDLETHLKARLLLRGGRQLTLTDAGRNYVAACKRIVEDVAEAERAASGEYRAPTGDLVITAPLVFGRMHVLPVVAEFLKAYADIHVRLQLSDRVVNLLEDHVDMAVRIGTLPDSSLIATRVGLGGSVVFACPTYLAARGIPRTPEDLAAHDCIAFDAIGSADHWDFQRNHAPVQIPIRPRLRANTVEAVIDAALAGLGLARAMSYPIRQALADGALRVVLQDYQMPPVAVSLVYPSQRLLPLKLRAFLDFAAPRLRARLEPQAVK